MEINIDELTPMMQKYMETKQEYKDCILFYRLGDFYEMFFEDALTASRELEITLTGKELWSGRTGAYVRSSFSCGGRISEQVWYQKGYKVAICEQVEDPKLAKGLVKREVIQNCHTGYQSGYTRPWMKQKIIIIMCIVYVDRSIRNFRGRCHHR